MSHLNVVPFSFHAENGDNGSRDSSRVSMFQLKHDAGIRIKGYELARSMLSK